MSLASVVPTSYSLILCLMITPEKIKRLKDLSPKERIAVCREKPELFAAYYFPHYISSAFSSFHYEMFQDTKDLMDGKITEAAWIAFRESGKTSIALMLLVYSICYEKYEYINVDSYDSVNAKRLLFDCVLELQTNKRILNDFGNIYNTKRSADEVTQKSVKDFVTNPTYDSDGNKVKEGIRVEAHSTGQPVRGRRHGAFRPQLLILDDFENEQTIRSEAYTDEIHRHIQSFKGGLDSSKGRVLYLANYLSEFANVQSIIERGKVDSGLRVRIIPIADESGNPTWPEKYCKGQDEVSQGRVSIEALRKRMWTPERGDVDFMSEMMCQPVDFSHSEFKKSWFDNRYTLPELQGKILNTFCAFDNAPMSKDSEKADFIGCNVVSVDSENVWYSRYVKRYRFNTPELIDAIFWIHNTFHPKSIGVEQKAYQGMIKPYLDKRAGELNTYPIVEELKDQGRNKEAKIRGALQGRFSTGYIKLQKYATDDTQYLIQELAQFPNGKYDDLCDSLSQISDIAYPPGHERKEPTTLAEYKKREVESAYERYKNANEPDYSESI